ncbi:DUF2520 domain-containing protein [Demequina sp.]|uniref:Rossmann-like and DUF2520 domain-containing protein n=1 Tax=Demequina sp. TaxID=2050685 RepID=UPI0025C09A20|nr:DUF2520 domain-containing protein [Demequina sp.]
MTAPNSPSKPGRLTVGIVGAGKVGASFGASLRLAGHAVVGASGVSEASVTRIDTMLAGVPRMDVEEVVRRSELVFLAVPDDAITELVEGLASVGAWRGGLLVAHCSGRLGLDALDAAARAGAIPLAIHPAMTFTGTSLDLDRMVGATFAVTAPAAFLPIAQALVVEMGGEPIVLEDAARPLYHAALVHGANHVVTLVSQAAALLSDAGVEDPGRLLGPLVHASIDGALADAPGAVTTLTGPVVRGDAGTVASHMAALAARPEAAHAYRAMAHATADIALTSGRLGPADYAAVIAALGEN